MKKLLLILLLISGEAVAEDYFDKCETFNGGGFLCAGHDSKLVCTQVINEKTGYSVSCFPTNTKAK